MFALLHSFLDPQQADPSFHYHRGEASPHVLSLIVTRASTCSVLTLRLKFFVTKVFFFVFYPFLFDVHARVSVCVWLLPTKYILSRLYFPRLTKICSHGALAGSRPYLPSTFLARQVPQPTFSANALRADATHAPFLTAHSEDRRKLRT